jgi:hypothetical protein
MRIRFSIRWLLLAFVLAASFCWWWDKPRRTANTLVEAIDAGDMDAFNGLLERFKLTGTPKMRVVDRRQSATDWLRGISRLTVEADIGEVMIIDLEVRRHKAVRAARLPDATMSL